MSFAKNLTGSVARASNIQPRFDCIEHGPDRYVQADPVIADAPAAINTAADVASFDADIVRIRTSVAPPFRRAKDADDRGFRGDGEMGRRRIAADINFREFRQFVKAF